jgi:transcriptional regulator with XRE-family HTH domain
MPDNFDRDAFYTALNAVRLSRRLTWKDVAEETGIAASTLSRMGQGANPDVDGLAGLLSWANLKAEAFIPAQRKAEAEPLAKISALLRADPKLSAQNAKLLEEILLSTYKKLRGK